LCQSKLHSTGKKLHKTHEFYLFFVWALHAMATASLFPPLTFFENDLPPLTSRAKVRAPSVDAAALSAAGLALLRVPQLPVVYTADSWTKAESGVIPDCELPVGLVVLSVLTNAPLNASTGLIARLVNELGQAALNENLPRHESTFQQCLTIQCGRVLAAGTGTDSNSTRSTSGTCTEPMTKRRRISAPLYSADAAGLGVSLRRVHVQSSPAAGSADFVLPFAFNLFCRSNFAPFTPADAHGRRPCLLNRGLAAIHHREELRLRPRACAAVPESVHAATASLCVAALELVGATIADAALFSREFLKLQIFDTSSAAHKKVVHQFQIDILDMLARQLAEASLFPEKLVPRPVLLAFFNHCVALEFFFLHPLAEHHVFNEQATIESVVALALSAGSGMSIDCAAMPEALRLDLPAAVAHRVNSGGTGVRCTVSDYDLSLTLRSALSH
jgi:hypothetical protein